MQKILYVGSFFENSNSDLRSKTFAELGYQVVNFDLVEFKIFIIYRLLNKYIKQHFGLRKLNEKLIKEVSYFKPDIIFVDKGMEIFPSTLKSIKTEANKLIHYNPDDPFGLYSKGWHIFLKAIPYYDLHYVSRIQNILEYERLGAKNVLPFDRSFSPKIHRPIKLNDDEIQKYKALVGFIGSHAKEREEFIAYLISEGISVAVYGNGWRGKKHWNIISKHYRGESIYGENYSKAICGMEIALHFLRRENRDEQDSRSFEIPACGVFMLAQRSEKHEQLFKEDKEAVFFKTKEELKEKIKFYLSNSNKREAIASAGYKRSLSSGYDHKSRLIELMERAKQILDQKE